MTLSHLPRIAALSVNVPSRELVTICHAAHRGMEGIILSISPRRLSTTELAPPRRSLVLAVVNCSSGWTLTSRTVPPVRAASYFCLCKLASPTSKLQPTVDTRSSHDFHTSVLYNHLPVFELLPHSRLPKLMRSGEKITLSWLKSSFQQLLKHRVWMTRTGFCVKASTTTLPPSMV